MRSGTTHGGNENGASAWPAWFSVAGLFVAFAATAVATAILSGLYAMTGGELAARPPGLTIAFTVAQDVLLILTAVGFAAAIARPTIRDFGLAPIKPRAFVKWLIAAAFLFYLVSAVYAAVVKPQGQQNVVDALGAERGTTYLLATAAVVIVLAPVAEEVFFRGFVYRSLRNRLSFPAAAATVGLLFGAIHYSGPQTLALLPVLALLGVVFCWLYERSGSLYPAIALHAVNNSLALAVTVRAEAADLVASAFGVAMVSGCLAVAARPSRTPRPGGLGASHG